MPYIDKIQIGNTSYDIKDSTGGGTVSEDYLPLAGGTMDAGVSVTFHDDDERYQSIINDNLIGMDDFTDGEGVVIAPESIYIFDASQNAEMVPSGVFFTPSTNTTAASITASHNILNNESTMTISAANIIIKGLPALDSSSSWRTALGLGNAAVKGVIDNSSASAISTGTSVTTERDVYYGLPTINGVHTYNSKTNYYTPTSGGTAGQVLISNGSGAPQWASEISVTNNDINIVNSDANGYINFDSAHTVKITNDGFAQLSTVPTSAMSQPFISFFTAGNERIANFSGIRGSDGAFGIELAAVNPNNSDHNSIRLGFSTNNSQFVQVSNKNLWRQALDFPQINGSSTYTTSSDFYAPTTAGTAGQMLISNGSGAPEWSTPTQVTIEDKRVEQAPISTDGYRPILLTTNVNQSATTTNTVKFTTNVAVNPSAGMLKINGLTSTNGIAINIPNLSDLSTTPTASEYHGAFDICTENGNQVGSIVGYHSDDNGYGIQITAPFGNNNWNTLALGASGSGAAYVWISQADKWRTALDIQRIQDNPEIVIGSSTPSNSNAKIWFETE